MTPRRLPFNNGSLENYSSVIEKEKNLKNLLYKWARNGPKLRTFAQAQISIS